jgi:beta-glucosidase
MIKLSFPQKLTGWIFLLFTGILPVQGQLVPWKNPVLSPEVRAQDLLSHLTTDEKISLMMNDSPAIERFGIPKYDWWNEALHGVARAGKATVFPQAIGLAATFDDKAVLETFTMVSDEARAKHHDAMKKGDFRRYSGLTFWTPNINIFRDPRWGRGMETYGEDPFLTSRMGVAVVKGLQGDPDSKYDKAHACAKHFAVHSGPEWNRHSYDAKNISDRDLWETYLPAFQSLVQEAGVKEVMCAYNRLEGEPCCGSNNLLINILRDKWGYDGIVVSDCGAISDFWVKGRHETQPDQPSASADAVLSGTDVECGNNFRSLKKALQEGKIREASIDTSVLRLLKARFELGMFDPDSLVSWASIPMSVVGCDLHQAKALEMARKSMVLLKNSNHTLPLSKSLKKVAVVGPNANDSTMLWANYNGFPQRTVTILEGIQKKLPEGSVMYEKGCELVSDKVFNSLFDECTSRGMKGFTATYYNSKDLSGEVLTTVQLTSPFNFNTAGNTVFAPGVPLTSFSARYTAVLKPAQSAEVVFRLSGDDGYRLKINGNEVISDWKDHFLTRKEYTMAVQQGTEYTLELEYFQGGGAGGALSFDFGVISDINYREVAEKVSDADIIIFAGGISPRLEGEEMRVDFPGFKGGDRTNIELPEVQRNLLKALKATGKTVVFVLCAGSAVAVTWENENVEAILDAGYAGQSGGTAVADVLFGDYNPAGRLPVTFYTSVSQLPDFEDYNMNKGRTYRYFRGKPLYPFGYGLSYTSFTYGKLQVPAKAHAGKPVTLSVSVKNNGTQDGDEVVQVYIRNLLDPDGPLKSLRAFRRVPIKAGKTEKVIFELAPESFQFYDPISKSMQVKPGTYEILCGGSSDDNSLQPFKVILKK